MFLTAQDVIPIIDVNIEVVYMEWRIFAAHVTQN
jgi:hypothetical protein